MVMNKRVLVIVTLMWKYQQSAVSGMNRPLRLRHDPIYGTGHAKIILRPLNLLQPYQLITG